MRLLSYAAVTVMVVATTSHQPNGGIKGLPPIKEDARGATSISMLQSMRHYARKWTKWGAFSRTRSAYRGAGTPLHQSHGREYSCTIYVSQCTCHLLPTHPHAHRLCQRLHTTYVDHTSCLSTHCTIETPSPANPFPSHTLSLLCIRKRRTADQPRPWVPLGRWNDWGVRVNPERKASPGHHHFTIPRKPEVWPTLPLHKGWKGVQRAGALHKRGQTRGAVS